MYTTIEPGLIARLSNDCPPDSYAGPSLELPPLHNPNVLTAPRRPLLLEPDASTRNGVAEPNLAAQHTALISSVDEGETSHKRSDRYPETVPAKVDRVLGGSSPQSLRKILDDGHEAPCTISSKKRHITDSKKDDFVQLPQPPKKQKAVKQVVPPIIIGLFEPPPQAALFPPIASSSFHDSHGRNTLNAAIPKVAELVGETTTTITYFKGKEKTSAILTHARKTTPVRTRKKWTEEETNNLLLGVHKHGIGNWTDILEDSSFLFNGRSGADLKDRFRTCCPAELRGHKTPYAQRVNKNHRSTSSLLFENILIDNDGGYVNPTEDSSTGRQPRKSRAHRKGLQDLAQLGIEGPFRKSHRRERRPFSEQEDSEILEGYKLHGPAWTRIQKDPRFHLLSRQPTDLRDRLRNKHPEKFHTDNKIRDKKIGVASQASNGVQNMNYKEDEPLFGESRQSATILQPLGLEMVERVGETNAKDHVDPSSIHISLPLHQTSSREGHLLQKSIPQATSKAALFQPQNHIFSLKDNFTFPEQPGIDSTDTLPFSQSFDWSGTVTAPFTNSMGEMDISRLLLDESWPEIPSSSGKDKQNLTDISNILTSNAESSGSGFYSMLEDAHLVDLQDSTF